MNANQAELQELEATEQHLKRQQASLTERLSRLENQSSFKREAAASAFEEQLKEKEAIEAENAAARAKIAENEAMVSWPVMHADRHICVSCHSLLQVIRLVDWKKYEYPASQVIDLTWKYRSN